MFFFQNTNIIITDIIFLLGFSKNNQPVLKILRIQHSAKSRKILRFRFM